MPKRRRERDRPKAANDAAYNPNKRVLLSYESDDQTGSDSEFLDQPAGTGHPQASDASISNYQIADYDQSDDNASVGQSDVKNEVPTGVNQEKAEAVEDEEEDYKPPQPKKERRRQTKVGKNQTTNQLPALGSLTYQWDEDFDETDEEAYDTEEDEAMAYLRAVRSERQTLPAVLRATGEDEAGYDVGDSRGYLDDGTYIAYSQTGPATPDDAKKLVMPQEAFTTALKGRFLRQKTQVHADVKPDAVASLDGDHWTKYYAERPMSKEGWLRILNEVNPLPAQVRAFDQKTTFGLLELAQTVHLVKSKDISSTGSIWIWTLLAKLDDVGTMDNGQVSVIREFGKQAVLILISFRDPNIANQLEAMGDAADPKETKDEDQQKTNPTITDETSLEERRENTLATLDMILTIVGEVFGQRDLLEFRRSWEIES